MVVKSLSTLRDVDIKSLTSLCQSVTVVLIPACWAAAAALLLMMMMLIMVMCTACDCDVGGTRDATCDKSTGQCRCKPRVNGRRCDRFHSLTVSYYISLLLLLLLLLLLVMGYVSAS